ncbi:MAG: hypothetical protein ABI456_07990 [Ktedonobacteraceae bacterium]
MGAPNRSSRSLLLANWFYQAIPFTIVVIVLNLIVGAFASWIAAIVPMPERLKALYLLIEANIVVSVAVGICLSIILSLIWLLARTIREAPIEPTKKEVRDLYLKRVLEETREYELKQLFPGLTTKYLPPAKLGQIFYQPNFFYAYSTWSTKNQKFVKSKKEITTNLLLSRQKTLQYTWEDFSHVERLVLSIADLWASMTKDSPVAIILGYPGSGKSTLVQAFAYHMAERFQRLDSFPAITDIDVRRVLSHSKFLEQPLLPIKIPLLPISVSLAEFANEKADDIHLTLADFIVDHQFVHWNIASIRKTLEAHLERGNCLVLFDGLNAIIADREAVKIEIKAFIRRYVKNRFIITSRTAGYDRACFNNYPHYHIDELTLEQIKNNISNWCSLVVTEERKNAIHEVERERIKNKIEARIMSLAEHVEQSRADEQLHELMKQPLLLTLLILVAVTTDEAIFTNLQRRIQVYKVAIPILLQSYKNSRSEPIFSEEIAMQYVGPLAFMMVEEGKRWLNRSEIKQILKGNQLAVNAILKQIPEAGGIFIESPEGKFGFSLRTYQEYFAARHLLSGIVVEDEQSQDSAIEKLVLLTYKKDIWREPFILAVAFQSYEEDSEIANKIVQKLLQISCAKPFPDQLPGLGLARATLMEVNPHSLKENILYEIAAALIVAYEQAFKQVRFDLCEHIGTQLCSWLDHLAYEPDYTQAICVALYEHASISLMPILIEENSKCLKLLHQLLSTPHTKQLFLSTIEVCADSICDGLAKRNNIQPGTIFEFLRHSFASKTDELTLRIVLQIMAATQSNPLRQCCANALKYAHPSTVEAEELLQLWQQFSKAP